MLFSLFDSSVHHRHYAKEIFPHNAKEILAHYAKEILTHYAKETFAIMQKKSLPLCKRNPCTFSKTLQQYKSLLQQRVIAHVHAVEKMRISPAIAAMPG